MTQAQTGKPEKYIYLAILVYWITGVLVAAYVVSSSNVASIHANFPPALLASYLVGISLIVFQSYFRNVGLGILFSIAVPCIPLVVGLSWLFPLMALAFTVVAWRRRLEIGESVGNVGLLDLAMLVIASVAFAVITLTYKQDADFFLLWDTRLERFSNDPLYHSALAAMIKNYGVSSVGLDGLVVRHYHILSHILFAAMSFGTGLPVMTAYGTFQFILFAPLLMLAIVATAETIRSSANPQVFLVRIVALFLALNLVETWPTFAKFAVWTSYFASQSYEIGLIFMFATICAMRIERASPRLITLVTLVVLTTTTKISVGAICFALVAIHLALFDRATRAKRLVAGIGMTVGFVTVSYGIASQAWVTEDYVYLLFSIFSSGKVLQYGLTIVLAEIVAAAAYIALHRWPALRKFGVAACVLCGATLLAYLWLHTDIYIPENPARLKILRDHAGLVGDSVHPEFWANLGTFTLVHFSFTWVLFILIFNLSLFGRGKARPTYESLLYSLAALGISWPILYFVNLGSAEYYFSNVAMFIALPYLLIVLTEALSCGPWRRRVAASVVPLFVLAALLYFPLDINYGKNFIQLESAAKRKIRETGEPIAGNFSKIVDHLDEIRSDLSTKNLGVYIAKEETEFWASTDKRCAARSFIIPSVSERPGLLALPDPSLCLAQNYGFEDYRRDEFEMSRQPRVENAVLLKLAADAGLDGYVDVRAGGWTVYRQQRPNQTLQH